MAKSLSNEEEEDIKEEARRAARQAIRTSADRDKDLRSDTPEVKQDDQSDSEDM